MDKHKNGIKKTQNIYCCKYQSTLRKTITVNKLFYSILFNPLNTLDGKNTQNISRITSIHKVNFS